MAGAWEVVAGGCLVIWAILLFARGGFWRADQRLSGAPPDRSAWPAVVAVVPARDEAAVIAESITGLLRQDYPGRFGVVLVDDHSTDDTGTIASRSAAAAGASERLTLVAGERLPGGWSGKLWALAQGVERAGAVAPDAAWLLLTDADIRHDPVSLRRLVAKAERDGCDLVSLMVRLDLGGLWGRLLIPAFVFFFQKLYPFPWVNDPRRRTAAAAGGCILIRRTMLVRIGGIAAIHGALIDDCALAAAVKAAGGRLWLGLSSDLVSLRPYGGFRGIWDMVVRTAYTQLGHSPLLLAGTVIGMALTYLAGPLAVLIWPWHGSAPAAALGLAAWIVMSVAYRPTLALYRQPAAAAYLLPLAGLLYSMMTVGSAVRHWRGRGGAWKGRTYPAGAMTGSALEGSSR